MDMIRMNLLSRMEDLPGFCSVSMLLDRDNGRASMAVTYENRQSMDRALEQALPMRAEFEQQTGWRFTEIAEFDLALAHPAYRDGLTVRPVHAAGRAPRLHASGHRPPRIAAGLAQQPVEHRGVVRHRHHRPVHLARISGAATAKPCPNSRHACALTGSAR